MTDKQVVCKWEACTCSTKKINPEDEPLLKASIDATILRLIQQFHLCISYEPDVVHITWETAVSKTRVFCSKWEIGI